MSFEVPCIKYFVIDEITNGDSFGGDKPYDDLISAMSSARYQWAHLSDYDKKRRSAFYVVSGGLDDFGCYDACAGGNIHYDFLESEG